MEQLYLLSVDTLRTYVEQYPTLAPLIFIIGRGIPILVAPVPGITFDALGLAAFGVWRGLLYAVVGVHLAAAAAFLLGRYAKSFLKRWVSFEKVENWERKLSEKQTFWGLVLFRLATSPAFDYISYAAGFTSMSLSRYLLVTFFGTFPFMFSFYFFGEQFLDGGLGIFVGFVLIVALLLFFIFMWINKRDSRKKRGQSSGGEDK